MERVGLRPFQFVKNNFVKKWIFIGVGDEVIKINFHTGLLLTSSALMKACKKAGSRLLNPLFS